MSEELDQVYEVPKSELIYDQTPSAPSMVNYLIAIGLFVLYASSNVYIATLVGKSGAEIVGAAIGSIIWPIVVVGVSSIWKKNRNSKVRVKVFTLTVAALFILQIVTYISIGLYAGRY